MTACFRGPGAESYAGIAQYRRTVVFHYLFRRSGGVSTPMAVFRQTDVRDVLRRELMHGALRIMAIPYPERYGYEIAQGHTMARIRATRVGTGTRVRVSGHLRASDMGRLEHACGDALTRDPLQLHLDLMRVSDMDDTAVAVVARLRRRGAEVRQPRGDAGAGRNGNGKTLER